jgi:hypothetical protein
LSCSFLQFQQYSYRYYDDYGLPHLFVLLFSWYFFLSIKLESYCRDYYRKQNQNETYKNQTTVAVENAFQRCFKPVVYLFEYVHALYLQFVPLYGLRSGGTSGMPL